MPDLADQGNTFPGYWKFDQNGESHRKLQIGKDGNSAFTNVLALPGSDFIAKMVERTITQA